MTRNLSAVLLILVALFALGCSGGSTGPGAPEKIATEQQVQDMVAARKIFDASNKDWNALPADQKAQFVKLTGGNEAQSQSWWNTMAKPNGDRSPDPTRGPR